MGVFGPCDLAGAGFETGTTEGALIIVMSDCPVYQLQPWICFILHRVTSMFVITLDSDYDDRVRSSPSFDTMMQSNVRGWRVEFLEKWGVGSSGDILSGYFIFPLSLCGRGTSSSFLRGFGSCRESLQ